MRVLGWAAGLVGAMLVACASAHPPPPAVTAPEEHDAAPEEPAPVETVTNLDAPERSVPPSTKSYDEALS
ncbi:MAG TPA: hypothetical protein VLT33_33420, partial [Labilithrix sp.]|nr:hypothetical protein [Labilithrix sp.]